MPEMFGIMAIVNVLLMGVQMFSDIGIGPSIIQNKRGDDTNFINTAWTLQIIRGFMIWMVICAIALALWLNNKYNYINIGDVYKYPSLPELLIVTGISAVISGFNSTSIFLTNRSMALGRLTLINLFSQASGLGIMIYFAWTKHSIWALAVGVLVNSFLDMLLSHLFLPGKINKPCFDKSSLKDLISFGKWIFLGTAIGFIAGQGDRILLGNYLSVEQFGVYSIAFMLSSAFSSLMSTLSHKVIFPLFSKTYRENPEELKNKMVKVKKIFFLTSILLCSILTYYIQDIIGLLYDNRYQDAGWMTQLLLMRSAIFSLWVPNSIALTSMGYPRYYTTCSALKAALMFIGTVYVASAYGVKEIVFVIGIYDFISIPFFWLMSKKYKLLSLKTEMGLFALLAIFIVYTTNSCFDSLIFNYFFE